jgi:hypothetical protein
MGVLRMPEIEKEVEEFMSKNSMELEFSGEPHGEGTSSLLENIRMSTFLSF